MTQFVEKKFCELDHLGRVCRILQTGILQTGPNSNEQQPVRARRECGYNQKNVYDYGGFYSIDTDEGYKKELEVG